MSNVQKCPHCQKVSFFSGSNICVFCKKDMTIAPKYDLPEEFMNIFNNFDK